MSLFIGTSGWAYKEWNQSRIMCPQLRCGGRVKLLRRHNKVGPNRQRLPSYLPQRCTHIWYVPRN